jgi:thioesterase domain-containing protein
MLVEERPTCWRVSAIEYASPGFTELDGQRYIQVFYATFSAYQRYTPGPWAGRLTLFRTAAGDAAFAEPTLGWSAFAGDGVEIIDIPGDHITLVRPPHVEELAEQIFAALARSG